jgi:hypothetical protein
MASRMATSARTSRAPASPAMTDQLPDRTRWALDAYAALLLDRRITQQQLLTIDEHVVEAELNIKAAAITDGVTTGRLNKAKLVLAEATGIDMAGPSIAPTNGVRPARRRSAPAARRSTPTTRHRST